MTDSVSGLLGSSWIPGFLRGDEEGVAAGEREGSDAGGSEAEAVNHHTPPTPQQPGPSGYVRQLSSRSHATLYPEEGVLQ